MSITFIEKQIIFDGLTLSSFVVFEYFHLLIVPMEEVSLLALETRSILIG